MSLNKHLSILFAMIFACVTLFTAGGSAQAASLGTVDFPISCTPESQETVERGMALLHHMMYWQAEAEFKSVTESEPDCAMAWWGISMTHFHPLWAPPGAKALEKGAAAIKKAKELGGKTDREKAYIAAAGAFYNNYKGRSNAQRLKTWDTAQKAVYVKWPDDMDAVALFGLSQLATAPKNDKNFARQRQTGAMLEKMHAKAPDHPAGFHYLIHAYDNPLLAHKALEVARGYDKMAPEVPHALHMPSHIFVRLGLWEETAEWNGRSATAAQKGGMDSPLALHYMHALDYELYAYLQLSENKKAKKVLDRVNSVKDIRSSFPAAYAIAAVRARFPLEQKLWKDAAALEVRVPESFPWEKYPWVESISWFAKGIGAARSGDVADAKKALEKLTALHTSSVERGKKYWSILADAQRQTVAAWIEYIDGDKMKALAAMFAAAALEDSVDKHPVTPGHALPARELLADMLLDSGQAEQALKAYEQSLASSPNRLNPFYGAAQAAAKMGDKEKAKSYYTKLIELAGEGEQRPETDAARAYLKGK